MSRVNYSSSTITILCESDPLSRGRPGRACDPSRLWLLFRAPPPLVRHVPFPELGEVFPDRRRQCWPAAAAAAAGCQTSFCCVV